MTREENVVYIMRMLPYSHVEKTRRVIAEAVVDLFMRERSETIELCARVAEHQETICGLSMSRRSTCLDIAQNIRRLNESLGSW